MSNLAIIGTHWGDEGKGKVVDLLAERFDMVARFQGGHNAGHSVYVGEREFAFHLIPAGIVRDGMACVIGNGVVLSPEAFFSEIEQLAGQGVSVDDRLFVSDRAHIITDWHLAYERAAEERTKIGTTLRGIGPAYGAKIERAGVRVVDLFNDSSLAAKVTDSVELVNQRLAHHDWYQPLEASKQVDKLLAFGERLRPFVRDTSVLLHERMRNGDAILFEGAQATMLDIDHGTYPYVTSSNSSAGGICSGLGVGPREVHGVLAVTKAYSTRVGEGPMPTELTGATGDYLRERGREYGVSTGRPRRCGWFDAVAAKHACRVNGIDILALTLLDVLDELDEIPVGVAYKLKGGERVTNFPADTSRLDGATVEYKTMPGWKSPSSGARQLSDLPNVALDYVKHLEDFLETPIGVISVGADRAETIVREEHFDKWPARGER